MTKEEFNLIKKIININFNELKKVYISGNIKRCYSYSEFKIIFTNENKIDVYTEDYYYIGSISVFAGGYVNDFINSNKNECIEFKRILDILILNHKLGLNLSNIKQDKKVNKI